MEVSLDQLLGLWCFWKEVFANAPSFPASLLEPHWMGPWKDPWSSFSCTLRGVKVFELFPSGFRILILKQILFHPRTSKIQTVPVIKQWKEGGSFSHLGLTQVPVETSSLFAVQNWFGVRQRKKYILYKLVVMTDWVRHVLTILETNENVWNHYLSLQ